MSRKPWTEEELYRLKRTYLAHGWKAAVRSMPGRSLKSVGGKIAREGWTLRDLPHGVKGAVVGNSEVALALGMLPAAAHRWLSTHPEGFRRGAYWVVPARALTDEVARRRSVPQSPRHGYLTSPQVCAVLGVSPPSTCSLLRRLRHSGWVRFHTFEPRCGVVRYAYLESDVYAYRTRRRAWLTRRTKVSARQAA